SVTNNTCGAFTNVVTASGTSPCGTLVQAKSTDRKSVVEGKSIAVTKTCNTVVAGQPNLVTAVVTNCGNLVLTNITVSDDLYGSTGSIASLLPGGSTNLPTSVTNNTCGTFTNVVTASGTSPCGTLVQAKS